MDMAQDDKEVNNNAHSHFSTIDHKLHHRNEVKPKDHHWVDSPIYHKSKGKFLGLTFWDIQLYI